MDGKKRSQPVNTSPFHPFPFTKCLRPYLPDDQNDILVSLPPVEASIDAGIATIAPHLHSPRRPARGEPRPTAAGLPMATGPSGRAQPGRIGAARRR